ncbi:RNA methyltransferase [Halothiobacillus sp.]|uniref:RNA methyltransferase n=1 Tax=Halothiobacillus sp. TaxID=1891311 RepID=UPI00262EC8C3|nr:RNA methyltransferase [Halothiobacillus sp.]
MTSSSAIHHASSPDARADRIQIVLCGTSHTGNLGAVARAMKNMGLHRLVLVSPKATIDDQAMATAKHAADILNTARQVDNLPDALADSVEVWATTARPRDLHLPVLSARAAAEVIAATPSTGMISIVFGAERTGLTNQELSWAQRIIEIPANPDYPVLNLGQAVQIVAYEWRMAHETARSSPQTEIENLATSVEWAAFEQRLAEQLDRTSFFHRTGSAEKDIAANRERLMARLRVLCRRANPTRNELAVMQGMLRALTESTTPQSGANI